MRHMTIEIELIVKHVEEFKLVTKGYSHFGKINDFDFDKKLCQSIEEVKKYYKTDTVILSNISIH